MRLRKGVLVSVSSFSSALCAFLMRSASGETSLQFSPSSSSLFSPHVIASSTPILRASGCPSSRSRMRRRSTSTGSASFSSVSFLGFSRPSQGFSRMSRFLSARRIMESSAMAMPCAVVPDKGLPEMDASPVRRAT